MSNVDNNVDNISGPWHYKDITKLFVHYKITIDGSQCSNKIALANLRRRGFPEKAASFQYTYYSWLRFKLTAKKEEPLKSLEEVLAEKSLFLTVLQIVNRYYQQNPECANGEGIEKLKGPHQFEDRNDLSRLHYYGTNGFYKWYMKTEFLKQMERMFGMDSPQRKAELFEFKPTKEKIAAKQFEQLLQQTHDALNHDLAKNQIEQRLKPYSGPQCHEDRENETRRNYNVSFRSKVTSGAVVPNPKATTDETMTTDLSPSKTSELDSSQESQSELGKFKDCHFRVCSRCEKTRLFDKRASKCFPLGSYFYANRNIRPVFHCDMLVDISCDTEEDITLLPLPEKIPPSYSWLIVEMSNKPINQPNIDNEHQ